MTAMDQDTILTELKSLRTSTMIASKTALNMDEATTFLGLSESRIHALKNAGEIPYYKQGKYIYFNKTELEEWMLENRMPTKKEIESEAIRRRPKN